MIDHFDLVTDFKVFYQYINALGPEVPVLRIKILDKTKLKSNHYWLMALLGKLPTLQIVKLQKSASMHCGADMYKFLLKGFTYMQQNSRSLRKIEMNGVLANSEDFLYPILKTQPTLTILKFANSGITQAESKAIGKVLADFIDVREVDLTNCKLRLEHAKDIADGIMRAKKLEVFKAGLNPDM